MIWFILGAGAGFLIGAIGMAMMKTASEADDSIEEFYKRFDEEKKNRSSFEPPFFIVFTLPFRSLLRLQFLLLLPLLRVLRLRFPVRP